MATILKETDFDLGVLRLNKNQNTINDFEALIDHTKEKHLIKNILGITLGAAFIADLTGDPLIPVAAVNTTIFEPFEFEYGDASYYCKGLKEILKGLLYAEFVSDQGVVNQSGGNVSLTQEAVTGEGLHAKAIIEFNRAAREVDYLQMYVDDNPDDYPDFDGSIINFRGTI